MPANFTTSANKTAANPAYAAGCAAPYSIQGAKSTCILDANEYGTALYGNQQVTFYGRATRQFSDDHIVTVDDVRGQEYILGAKNPTTSLAANGVNATVPSSSKWYPGASGGVPAVAALKGEPVIVTWSVADLGLAVTRDVQVNQRLGVNDEGHLGAWDYKAGLVYGISTRENYYDSGYDNQVEKDSEFVSNIGRFGLASNGTTSSLPILTFRWKHTLTLRWKNGNWGSQLTQNYNSGYHDQNLVAAQYFRDIEPYSVWNLTGTYTGFKHIGITAGVTNLLDAKPPVTNHNGYSFGDLNSAASAIGRAFNLRMTYTYRQAPGHRKLMYPASPPAGDADFLPARTPLPTASSAVQQNRSTKKSTKLRSLGDRYRSGKQTTLIGWLERHKIVNGVTLWNVPVRKLCQKRKNHCSPPVALSRAPDWRRQSFLSLILQPWIASAETGSRQTQ
jgi:hypothetical protein